LDVGTNYEGESNKPSKCENCEVLKAKSKVYCENLFKAGYGNCKFKYCSKFPKLCLTKLELVLNQFFKRKPKSLVAFSNTTKTKLHPFKPIFIVCVKAILLGLVELDFLMFQMA